MIELLVVVAIISLLVSILLPSLNKAKDMAKAVLCASNARQLGLAFAAYSVEWDGRFPPAYTFDSAGNYVWWKTYISPYVSDQLQQMWCPSVTDTPTNSLIYNCAIIPEEFWPPAWKSSRNWSLQVDKDGQLDTLMVLGEASQGAWFGRPPYRLQVFTPRSTWESKNAYLSGVAPSGHYSAAVFEERHNEKMNVLFADGRVDHFTIVDVVEKNYCRWIGYQDLP